MGMSVATQYGSRHRETGCPALRLNAADDGKPTKTNIPCPALTRTFARCG